MFFHPKNLKSENNNPWFNILLHTQSIVCATVDSQCLEYLGYMTLQIGDKLKQVFLMALMTSFYAPVASKIKTQIATL